MTFSTLISAPDLALHLHDPQWVVIDCRHDLTNPQAGRDLYAAGHIPGAVFAHLDTDLAGAPTGPDGRFRGRHPLPDQAAFIATLRRLGIDDDSQVIVYDAQGGAFAARLWWMLRWVGHDAVAVLDGGLPAWLAEGGALSSEVVAHASGTMTLRPTRTAQVDIDQVLANLTTHQHTVIDARAPDRFRGENETIDAVGGHIPGAKNRFFKDNLLPDGRFKSASALRAELTALIDAPEQAIMQCGSGVTACHNLLALEVAGLHGASLYVGSWSEWSSDLARPLER